MWCWSREAWIKQKRELPTQVRPQALRREPRQSESSRYYQKICQGGLRVVACVHSFLADQPLSRAGHRICPKLVLESPCLHLGSAEPRWFQQVVTGFAPPDSLSAGERS